MSQTSHAVQGYVLSWILGAFGGLRAAGIYAASWSIVQLASPFVQGVGNAMGPLLAKRFADGGVEALENATRRFTGYASVIAILYVVAILLLGPLAVTTIYGDQFGNTTLTMVLLAASVAVSATALIATKVISVTEFPQINFALNLSVLAMTTLFATALGYLYELEGAAAGLLIAAVLGAGAKWVCYRFAISNIRGASP